MTELVKSDEIQVRGFFFEDPGGYVFEVQQFLKPELASVFHGRKPLIVDRPACTPSVDAGQSAN